MKKRLLIGVIITECQIDFQEKILSGIISQAFKTNCDIAVLTPYHDFCYRHPKKDLERKIFELIRSDRFDGFLYDRSTIRAEDIQKYVDGLLERSGKPVMLIDSGEHKRFDSTLIDDRSAFEQLTDHMIDIHGARSIYCLTGPKNIFVSEERLLGFRDSLKKHGITCPREWCIYGDFWVDAAKELAGKIVSGELQKPDAIVCGNDYSAIALTKALVSGGINVPEDIAVAGYDSSPEGADFTPAITSYDRPLYQLGAESFRRLYRLITGKICPKAPDKAVTMRLGCSCGCSGKLRRNTSEQRRMTVNKRFETDLLHRDMLYDVTAAETPSELADRLDSYTYYIYKLMHMRICLTREYINSPAKSITERLDFTADSEMQTIMNKVSMKRTYGDDSFKAADLPFFCGDLPYPSAYYISPLNFGENFFGFAAVSFGKVPISFSDLYIFWINYLNVALEQVRIRSILNRTASDASRAVFYDKATGLLSREGMKNAFTRRKKGGNTSFIRIQLTGLSDPMYQGDEEKCTAIMKSFSDILSHAIRENEILGVWTAYTFGIITPDPDRGEELFSRITSSLKEHRCDIDLTLGMHTQPSEPEPSIVTSLHKAAMNRLFTYTVSESTANPRYEKLCLLRARLMKDPEQPWNIGKIAGELYLSKSYLQKIYKSYFGKSIIEEMIIFRIEKAKELLTSTDMTVTDIAKECGYSSYNYFVRQFKTAEGISPSEYRSKLRVEN